MIKETRGLPLRVLLIAHFLFIKFYDTYIPCSVSYTHLTLPTILLV